MHEFHSWSTQTEEAGMQPYTSCCTGRTEADSIPKVAFGLCCAWCFRKGEWSLEQLPNASSSTAELMIDTQSYALLMDAVNPETVTSSVPAGPPPPPRPAVPAGHLLYNVIDDMGCATVACEHCHNTQALCDCSLKISRCCNAENIHLWTRTQQNTQRLWPS